jgi:hypothetical protein
MHGKIFLSYAREDSEFTLKLAHDLRGENVAIWVDQMDIVPGEDWDQAVEKALYECTGLLIVLSPDAVNSRSVMDEVSFALEENKRVIPVVHRPCVIPFRLRRVQRVDLGSDYAGGLAGLIRTLAGTEPPGGNEQRTAEAPARSRGGDLARRHHLAGQAASEDPLPASLGDQGGHAGRPDLHPRQARARPASTTSGAGKSYWESRRPRLRTALQAGVAGAFFAAIAEVLVYANDDRVGSMGPSLLVTAALGGAVAGALWAAAGAIAGPRRTPWVWAVVTSLLVLGGWIVGFGTYQDVMGAAVILGWPVGGIVGATFGGEILKSRGETD